MCKMKYDSLLLYVERNMIEIGAYISWLGAYAVRTFWKWIKFEIESVERDLFARKYSTSLLTFLH